MDDLQKALRNIDLAIPKGKIRVVDVTKPSYPPSYSQNTKKEIHMLKCSENFQRQYTYLYPDRKPLLLTPKNECGIQKFICTTIRPTQLKYKEVYDYDGCAQFLAGYLNFEPLPSPVDLPSVVPSPTTVLHRQSGNCFDYSILLCSLLAGSGYDAYCVSGYATREVTTMDECREVCPLLKRDVKENVSESKKIERKYAVKATKDLSSKFEAKMADKELAKEKEKERKLKEADDARIAELEKPPPDKLHGLRVHCWVLILSGKREVPESFFIEALTGESKPLNFSGYLGIESVWNHTNLWVNMQDCSKGLKELRYDLGDALRWEFMFPNTDKPLLVIPEVNDEPLELDDEQTEPQDMAVDLPPSWVNEIKVNSEHFDRRFPNGKKTIIYKKAKLEKFSEYLNTDGLVTRLSVYNDTELRNRIEVQEFFKNRKDKLEKRVHNVVSGWVTEYFAPGRPRALKEHSFKMTSPGPENERVMLFYSSARVDGLSKRQETPTEMTEVFTGREDMLHHRYVLFSARVKKFEPQTSYSRPIAKMVEKFLRNQAIDADKDVAERSFLVSDDRIFLRYHRHDQNITASTREFIKPPNFSLDKTAQLQMTSDMTHTFQVNPYTKQIKELEVYNSMMKLLWDEKACKDSVRESENEVKEILEDRMREEMNPELSISVYDTDRNEKAKLRRKELERLVQEEEQRKRDTELDYLAPFLARVGNPDRLSPPDALRVKEDCLHDLKQRLIDKANLIQARFEAATEELQKKQAWYQEHQLNMAKEDEEDYLNFCSEAMFRIHILELRLNRHKEMAPQKYMMLDDRLRKDPRLCDFLS